MSKSRFSEIWKDPVWSKVISVVIVALASALWRWIDIESFKTSFNLLINWLKFQVPVWWVILGCFVVWLIIRLIKSIRLESTPLIHQRNPILDDKIGERTFQELFDILNDKLRVQTRNMRLSGIPAPEETILEMFYHTFDEFRSGVQFGEGLKMVRPGSGMEYRLNEEYKIKVLAPKLLEYGLIEVVDLNDGFIVESKEHPIAPSYCISDLGYKFHDNFKKLYMNNN